MSTILIVAGLTMLLAIFIMSNVAVNRLKKRPALIKPFGRYDDLLLALCTVGIPVAFILFIVGVFLNATA